MYFTTLPSPLGQITLASDGVAITGLWFEGQKYFAAGITEDTALQPDLPVFEQTSVWLESYFSGKPFPCLLPLMPQGTDFQKKVWQLLSEISFGETTTYGALAAKLQAQGMSGSARAVGNAVGHNPISILIPCHRVLGADGSLTGYAGGIDRKKYLLELERSCKAD